MNRGGLETVLTDARKHAVDKRNLRALLLIDNSFSLREKVGMRG